MERQNEPRRCFSPFKTFATPVLNSLQMMLDLKHMITADPEAPSESASSAMIGQAIAARNLASGAGPAHNLCFPFKRYEIDFSPTYLQIRQ